MTMTWLKLWTQICFYMLTIHVWCSNIKEVVEIERVLNNEFENICDWFVDNKLSIHFGEDKTKSILFASQRKIKTIKKLNIKYQDIEIKQHSQVTYLGCVMDETMSGEPTL